MGARVADRRYDQRVDRAGLCAGLAPATDRDDRADRQWAGRGAADPARHWRQTRRDATGRASRDQRGLVAVDPQKGTVLWRAPFPFKVSTAASPVVFEDIVYCSAGYGVGAGAFKISKSGSGFSAEQIWRRENECFNHWSTPVVKDGYLYGMFSFKEYGKGPLACVDIRTGKDMWKEEGFGPGQIILAGETLIALSDKGEVVAVEVDSKKYTELKRDDVLKGKVWSYPVLAYNHLFARSTEEGICIQFQ
jgi:hypothetical protein